MVLDLSRTYSFIRIKEGDKWATVFEVYFGHFESFVLSFGFINALISF